MSGHRWSVDYFDGAGWTPVTSGRSRFRAAVVFLICTFARPDTTHRLSWLGADLAIALFHQKPKKGRRR